MSGENSERCRLIARFFTEALEVSEATAEEDAARVEALLSEETVQQMELWLQAAEEFEQMAQEVSGAREDLQKTLEEMNDMSDLEAMFRN